MHFCAYFIVTLRNPTGERLISSSSDLRANFTLGPSSVLSQLFVSHALRKAGTQSKRSSDTAVLFLVVRSLRLRPVPVTPTKEENPMPDLGWPRARDSGMGMAMGKGRADAFTSCGPRRTPTRDWWGQLFSNVYTHPFTLCCSVLLTGHVSHRWKPSDGVRSSLCHYMNTSDSLS